MGMTIITVVLGTWIGLAGAGGVLYFLVKSGKIPVSAAQARGGSEANDTRSIMLEPILANLADAGGHAYVRLGLRVEISEAPGAESGAAAAPAGGEAASVEKAGAGKAAAGEASKSSNDVESSIRDTVLEVLGKQTSAGLLGPDGKEHLKIELKEAIERGGVRVDVRDLFFTDFLVQI